MTSKLHIRFVPHHVARYERRVSIVQAAYTVPLTVRAETYTERPLVPVKVVCTCTRRTTNAQFVRYAGGLRCRWCGEVQR